MNGNGISEERSIEERDVLARRKRNGDLIDSLVAGDAAMAFDILPFNRVFLAPPSDERRKSLPKLRVGDIFSLSRLPIAISPGPNPLSDALDHVGRVGVNFHRSWESLHLPEPRDHGLKLHLIVR